METLLTIAGIMLTLALHHFWALKYFMEAMVVQVTHTQYN